MTSATLPASVCLCLRLGKGRKSAGKCGKSRGKVGSTALSIGGTIGKSFWVKVCKLHQKVRRSFGSPVNGEKN